MGTDKTGRSGVKTRNLGTPAAASTTGIHAAVTDTGALVVVTTGITQPDYPRNITATAGGTAGDIKAIQPVIHGTNEADEEISETLPAFTVDTPGTVSGAKAFKTVTSIDLPAHDGTGATTAFGFGEVLGLGVKLERNTVIAAYRGGVKEGTPPTVLFSDSAMESNTVDLNSALNDTEILVDYYAP